MKTEFSKQRRGSALIGVLLLITVFIAIGATALSSMRSYYTASARNASWEEAYHAAESGAHIALARLAASQTGNFAITGVTTHGGEGSGTADVNVTISNVTILGGNYVQIRSVGSVPLSGNKDATYASHSGVGGTIDDLRPMYLRAKGGSSLSTPMTSRVVQVLAAVTESDSGYAFWVKNTFRLQNGNVNSPNTWADSYDSSDPSKSSTVNGIAGQYDVAKRQNNADIATTATSGGSIEMQGALLYGNLSTNNVSKNTLPINAVLNDSQKNNNWLRLTGSLDMTFSDQMPDQDPPAWATGSYVNYGNLQNNAITIASGTQANPTRYKFGNASAGMNLTLPAGQTEGYVEIWVEGNLNLNGGTNGSITLAKGVHAKIYFRDGLTVNGSAIVNNNRNASYLELLGARKNMGTSAINWNNGGELYAQIYAPWHEFNPNGTFNFYGRFGAYSFVGNNGVKLHFDEALGGGSGNGGSGDYELVSWTEDIR